MHFTPTDGKPVLATAASGPGIGIMHGPVLQRVTRRVVIKKFEVPVCHNIALALVSKENASTAAGKSPEYLQYR